MTANDDFLRDYFKDCQEAMRWRADSEYRLLQFLLIFYPVIVAAMSTLYQTGIEQTAYLALSIAASVLIVLTSLLITHKVYDGHRIYADIGRTVQQIWLYFGLFQPGAYLENETILPETLFDPKEGYGQGPGYKRTLWIVWIITAAIIAIVLTLGIIRDC